MVRSIGITILIFLFASHFQPAFAEIQQVGGMITKDASWKDITVVHTTEIFEGVSVTIESGTVRFRDGCNLIVSGTLIARSTTFTSANPDAKPGNWGNIRLTQTSKNSIMESCRIEFGRGIRIEGCNPELRDNTITQNKTDSRGGGIAVIAGKPLITGNTILHNSGYSGGGIFLKNVSDWTLSDNRIIGNQSASATEAGAVYAVDCQNLTLENLVIRNCRDNAIKLWRCRRISIKECQLVGNVTRWAGSAVLMVSSSHITLDRNAIVGNVSTARQGAITTISSYDGIVITKNLIAHSRGDAIVIEATNPDISFNSFIGNSNYALKNLSKQDCNAVNNFWNSAEKLTIQGQLFDRYSQTKRGRVIFTPFLTAPHVDVPPMPTLELTQSQTTAPPQPNRRSGGFWFWLGNWNWQNLFGNLFKGLMMSFFWAFLKPIIALIRSLFIILVVWAGIAMFIKLRFRDPSEKEKSSFNLDRLKNVPLVQRFRKKDNQPSG